MATVVRAHPRKGTRGVRRHYRLEMRPSPLHGRGAFALEDIPSGAVVARLSDKDDIVFNWGDTGMTLKQKRALDRYMKKVGSGFHVDTPMANVLPPLHGKATVFLATRPIKKGEELLVWL